MNNLPAAPRSPLAPALALAWLGIVVAIALLTLQRGVQFDSSILTLLPESQTSPMLREADKRVAHSYSRRLLLLVSGSEDAAVREAVARLAGALGDLDAVDTVRWRIDASEIGESRARLYPYRFVLLDWKVRKQLLEQDFDRLTQQALVKQLSPVGAGAGDLVGDPFAVFPEYQKQRADEFRLTIADGMLRAQAAASPTYLLLVELAGDPFSEATQRAVLDSIERQRTLSSEAVDEILISGMLIHAAAGAKQAKGEISTIGLGSLAGITLAVVMVFGRFKPLLLLLLPVATGCIFAASVTLLVFDRVHLVTFAFGAGLVGISIDYALHYLCQRRYMPSRQALGRLFAGLSLGLFSSVTAYAVMLLTPFPGLRQMATFSIAGLVGAWLGVVLWLPLLTAGDEARPISFAAVLARLRDRLPRIGDRRLRAVMLLAVVLSLAVLWRGEGRDDLRLLQTSPQDLLSQEQEVRELLGIADTSRYLLVSGENVEQCLQREESLHEALDTLIDSTAIDGYQALSSHLPSLPRQAENRALVADLYADSLAVLYSSLGLPDSLREQAREQLLQAGDEFLTLERWRQLGAADSLASMLIEGDGYAATLVRMRGAGDPDLPESLRQLADSLPGVEYVDRVERVSQLLGNYRRQVGQWIVVAYLLVMVALLSRYRGEAWRILLPPLLASLLTLAIQVLAGGGLNLFHMLALVLILGIGLDMGIFLAETGDEAHTWLAVSLSAFTSLLAFGLLAFSATPVLHHFGVVVAIGLCLVWLLTLLVRRPAPAGVGA